MRLRIFSNSWKIFQVAAFLTLIILNWIQLNKNSTSRGFSLTPNEIKDLLKNTSEDKKPLTFEEKVMKYKEEKLAKLAQERDLKEDTEKRTRSVNNWIQNPDLFKSLKNPGFGSVDKMDQFFHVDKILRLGHKRKEKAFAVFGIPTVSRKNAYYVIDTLKTLVDNLSEEEINEVVIVIFIAEQNDAYVNKVVNDVKKDFMKYVTNGSIQVIITDPKYYPDLDKLPRLFGDSKDRVKWRSKQSLDYSFLYYYCIGIGDYFIQLEDDIIAEENYLKKMKTFIAINKAEPWSVLEFGARGFIGMTYRGDVLPSLGKFVRFFFWTMPVDWLFRVYNDIYLHGNPTKYKLKPPIFKHVGKFSSLDGQVRKLEDLKHSNSQNGMPWRRRFQSSKGNPEALMKTTISGYTIPHDIDNPYSKKGIFWGKSLKDGDYIEITLTKPYDIKRIVISSGLPTYPKDIFSNTELYVTTNKDLPCSGYELIRSSSTALIDHVFKDKMNSVTCIKLVLTKVVTKNWLIVEEIAILE